MNNNMNIRSLILLVLLLTSHQMSCHEITKTPCPLSSEEKVAILAAHNNARAAVYPAAQTMPDLVWDDDLAATAQNWVNSCTASSRYIIDHNPKRSLGYVFDVGENIFASTAEVTDLSRPVTLWDSEKQYYNLETNTCRTGKVCSHYTQVVWAKSLKVGCGRAYCGNVAYKYTVVCNYGPGGNDKNQPYVAKTTCSSSPGSSSYFVSLHKLYILVFIAVLVAMR